MTRMTVFLLTLIVAICFMVGCGSSSLINGDPSDPIIVGPYKGDESDYYKRQYIKDMGHANHDTRNPTAEEARQYCSICHYIY